MQPDIERLVARARRAIDSSTDTVAKAGRVQLIAPIAAAITKRDAEGGELRYVLCAVLVPEEVDAQGDIYSADEVRKAAWGYLRNFRNVGLQHKGLLAPTRVSVVESYIVQTNTSIEGSKFTKGTWVMGLNVHDDALWSSIKSGELTGLSIGGWAKKTPVDA